MSRNALRFSSLPELLGGSCPEKDPFCINNRSTDDVVYRDRFRKDVERVFSYLVQAKIGSTALYTHSSYWFGVGFVASLLAGLRVVLLPNKQDKTLALLAGNQLLLSDIDSLCFLANSVNLLDCSANPEARCPLPQQLDSSNAVIEIFTSGSTGDAKRVIKSLANFETEIATLETLWGKSVQDKVVIASVSHQHVYGVLFRIMWPLYSGRVFADGLIEYPEQLECFDLNKTILISSPALLKRIQNEPTLNLPEIVFSSGGPLHEAANRKLCDRFGVVVWEVFGSTETGGVAVRNLIQKPIWTLMPGVVAVCREGVLQVTSPHCAGGYQLMGDKVEFVSQTEFTILGRTDRVIKLEEKRVSLTGVEQRLKEHQGVENAYAMVLSGNRDMLAVVIELNSNGNAFLESIGIRAFKQNMKQWLAALLEPVTLPRRIRLVTNIPLTPQGKIDTLAINRLFESE